ncbi:MAG: hypothetical protein JNK82_35145 [Myxococcaceae bacterium]|nr:hypothetical protein [Myxococcaceae bacterium]
MARAGKSVTDILLEMGAIDPQQLQSATLHAQQWGVTIERALVERRFCSPDDVLRAASRQSGYPVINLDAEAIDPSRADLIPLKFAEHARVVPLGLQGRRYEVLEVAVAAPVDLTMVDALLALTKKSRAVIHLSHDEAIGRAIARLYGKGGVAPPPPPPPRERKTNVQNEETFDFGEEPSPSQTVYLYGWHPAAMKAMAMMLEQGGLKAAALDDVGLEGIGQFDVVISTTLGLRTVLPGDAKVRCLLIICGTQEAGDPDDARSLGAKLYLRPPHSTEQLKKAVQHVTRPK